MGPDEVRKMSATPDSTLANPERLIADLQLQLAERTAERDAALQREAATAEVLQVINSSPGDLAPVFDAMLERALRLCGAAYGNLLSDDGELFQVLATTHDLPGHRFQTLPGTTLDAILKGENAVSIDDLANSDTYRF